MSEPLIERLKGHPALKKYKLLITSLTGEEHSALCAVHQTGVASGSPKGKESRPTPMEILKKLRRAEHKEVLALRDGERFRKAIVDIYLAGREQAGKRR